MRILTQPHPRLCVIIILLLVSIFYASPTQAQPTPALIPVYPTSVRVIHTLTPVNIRRGPSVAYRIIDTLTAGQTVQVTGLSRNRLWWRIRCPDGTIGNCFVSANGRYTKSGVAPPPPPNPNLPTSYVQNLQKWQSKRIGHYQVQIQRSCYCVPDATKPIVVEVLGGNVLQMRYADGSTLSSTNAAYFANISSIEQLFTLIANGIRAGYTRVEVTYDPVYGFPQQITIDRDRMIADDEAYYTLGQFRVLP